MAINTLKIKLKTCCKCLKLRKIWKRVENKLWCKPCYYKQFPPVRSKSVKPKRISPKSEKRIIQDKKYNKSRKKFLLDNPMCMAKFSVCTGPGCQIHHTYSGKDRSSHILQINSWWSICNSCHRHGHDKLSLEEALSIGFKRI